MTRKINPQNSKYFADPRPGWAGEGFIERKIIINSIQQVAHQSGQPVLYTNWF
jgi:hypothetical protein